MPRIFHHFRPDLFVIRPTRSPSTDDSTERLARIATVAPIAGQSDAWTASLIHTPTSAANGWHALRLRLGNDFVAIPVLVDEDGQHRYPTGLLTVRFLQTPNDRSIAAFARQYQLSVVRHAKFAKQQVIFKPVFSIDVFLPDLLDAVAGVDGVDAAWLDADSAIQRPGPWVMKSGPGAERKWIGMP